MPIPDFQQFMLPILELAGDGKEHTQADVLPMLIARFALTPEEANEKLPSGATTRLTNRAHWARIHMTRAGLLESPKRGVFKIAKRGQEVLHEKPPLIDNKFLKKFPEFVEFIKPKPGGVGASDDGGTGNDELKEPKTSREQLEDAFQTLQKNLAEELAQRVMKCSPAFFEQMVVDLLVAMGYGGTRADAGHAIGKSGDGGIDGIIKEDRLGLDIVYIQAKRWDGSVSRPEIQKFAGALVGQKANKGVFITTSKFTSEAKTYAGTIGLKIVLVDGPQLAQLMIEHGIGVAAEATFTVKRLDSDYFLEE